MNELKHKVELAQRRANRVRSATIGTTDQPRLSVNVSNLHITAQLIDDSMGKTLAYSSTVGQKLAGNMTEKAKFIGQDIAKKAKKAKVDKVVFDRGSRKYHGRVKALADAARNGGMEF